MPRSIVSCAKLWLPPLSDDHTASIHSKVVYTSRPIILIFFTTLWWTSLHVSFTPQLYERSIKLLQKVAGISYLMSILSRYIYGLKYFCNVNTFFPASPFLSPCSLDTTNLFPYYAHTIAPPRPSQRAHLTSSQQGDSQDQVFPIKMLSQCTTSTTIALQYGIKVPNACCSNFQRKLNTPKPYRFLCTFCNIAPVVNLFCGETYRIWKHFSKAPCVSYSICFHHDSKLLFYRSTSISFALFLGLLWTQIYLFIFSGEGETWGFRRYL